MIKQNKPKKPFYLRWWAFPIYVILAFIITGIIIGPGEQPTEETQPSITVEQPGAEVEEVEETVDVYLHGVEPTDEPHAPEATEDPNLDSNTIDGLNVNTAQVVCVNAAEQAAYPEKLKVHTVLGKKIEQISDHEIRFLWDVTLTSEAGGELKGELLCAVTGTDEAPVIEILEFR